MAEDTTPAMGRLLGTNNLQRAIDSFGATVESLKSVVSQMKGGQYQSNTGGQPSTWSTGPRNQGGGASNNGGGATFSAGSAYDRYVLGGGGGAKQGGGSGNNGGHGGMAAGFGAAVGAITAAGARNTPDQVTRDYVTRYAQTFTGGGYNATLRSLNGNLSIGNGTADRLSAEMNLYQTQGGNFTGARNSMGAMGILNPGMSASQLAAAQQSLGTGSTWARMRMYGIRTVGPQGQMATTQQVARQMGQRLGMGGRMTSAELQYNFNNMDSNFNQSLGLSGLSSDMQDMTKNYWVASTKAANRGMSQDRFDALAQQASGTGSSAAAAQKKLDSVGIKWADSGLQSMKNVAGKQEDLQNNLTQGFNTGLKNANAVLGTFYDQLTAITKGPLGKIAGWTEGASSLVGHVTNNPVTHVAEAYMGGKLFSKAATRVLGRGGTAAGGEAAGGGLLADAASFLGVGAVVAGGSWLSSRFTPRAHNGDKVYGPQTGAPGAAGGGMSLPGGAKLKGSILGGLGDPAGYGQAAAPDNGKNPSIQSGASGGGNAASLINIAKKYLGKPYHWGGSNPKSSFDCSGLMQWVFGQAGIKLPRTAAQQQKVGKPVAKTEVRPGDLVFWGNPAHHVAMVVGAGQIIEAPHTGTNIRIRKFSTSEITNARRVVGSVGNVGDLSNSQASSNEGGSQTGSVGGDTGNFFGTGADEASVLTSILSGGTPGSGGSAFGASTASTASTSGSGGDTAIGTAPSSVSGNAALGRKLAGARGWKGKEWDALYQLWQGESGWNNKAQNPHSTAYGIAQFLNGTWGPYGAKTSDPSKQIQYGLSYIKDRYGDPLGAESFKKKHNWYDKGAWRIEGDQNAVVHDGEMVIPKADAETIRAALTRQPVSQQKGSGRQVVLNFEPGSVVIQAGGTNDAHMKAAAKQFVDMIAQDNRLKEVAAG